MATSGRLLIAVATAALLVRVSFGSAIVSGFDSTSDGRNDDGTYTTGGCTNPFPGGTCAGTLVPIGFNIDFFGITTNSLYINTNGNVTLDAPLASPPPNEPYQLVDGFSEIIAPFYADVDTRNPASGVVTFGEGTFDGDPAFGVNWIGVGYFDDEADKLDSFQLLLVDTGANSFDIIFNYGSIQWETGDANFGTDGLGGYSAIAGFSDGTGNPSNSYELPGSGIPGSFIDGGPNALATNSLNSNVPGRYIFEFQDGELVPEPQTSIPIIIIGAILFLFNRRRDSHRATRSSGRMP